MEAFLMRGAGLNRNGHAPTGGKRHLFTETRGSSNLIRQNP